MFFCSPTENEICGSGDVILYGLSLLLLLLTEVEYVMVGLDLVDIMASRPLFGGRMLQNSNYTA